MTTTTPPSSSRQDTYTPSRRSTCPRVLAGRSCLTYRPASCLCTRWALDHARAWTDPHGAPLITAEPYDLPGEDLAELVADLAALDLTVTVSGDSSYYPGATFLLTIRRAEEVSRDT